MAADEVLLTDGFVLMDAMSAFEIGEPRMDSGMILEEDKKPPFDSTALLLPEELCWIMDRMFACEMLWHSGNTLSQTVYTLLYVHELQDLNPDFLPAGWPPNPDPDRPLELLTVVLRASVLGLLKCCDLAWRELSKRRIYDIEDWQSEKSEVSLLESVPVSIVLQRLDDACRWLRASSLPAEQKEALSDRILLRKHLTRLFNVGVSENLEDLGMAPPLMRANLDALQRVRTRPSTTPQEGSPALLAFDPRVSRQLHTVIPIRVVDLPEQTTVWDSLERLLYGWADVDYLRNTDTIASWKEFGSYWAWSPRRELPFAYTRSLMQGAFYEKRIVMGQYPAEWLVQQYFLETLGVSYDYICDILVTSWAGRDELALEDVERHIIKITSQNVQSFWYNPPRRRRHLMKSIIDLQALQDAFDVLKADVVVSNPRSVHIMAALPEAANMWKLTVAREIILSGFQQDLYAPHERPLAYWLVAHIIDQHIYLLETLRSLLMPGILMKLEWEYQITFLGSLQAMCIALYSSTTPTTSLSPSQLSLIFRRRYKWLFASNNGKSSEPLIHFPPLSNYIEDMENAEHKIVARSHHTLAQEMLSRLVETQSETICGDKEAEMRTEFARGLVVVNAKLMESVNSLDGPARALRWDPSYHPWFPDVTR
ncbi:Mak10 subunit, NatC N-terminal acetyltransferase-domain-containing protein [Irpex rosettiformis]|uniref:Mak10 subunit, NatC N-terminal acetyltransferase-domain-containing protein n=1 Tax=Irpex rosettiformis TaxID=378272 RepID=A0ACB8TVC9_9APHY|nr:Mak10 subunit, NatC N-terminal acetyltransferase-domain-containing protein [Irpex rosettiformis]